MDLSGQEAALRFRGFKQQNPAGVPCTFLLFPLCSAGVSFSQDALPGLVDFESGSPYLSLSCVIPCR